MIVTLSSFIITACSIAVIVDQASNDMCITNDDVRSSINNSRRSQPLLISQTEVL